MEARKGLHPTQPYYIPIAMRKSTLLTVCLTAALLVAAYPLPGAWRTAALIGAAAAGTAALITAVRGRRRHN